MSEHRFYDFRVVHCGECQGALYWARRPGSIDRWNLTHPVTTACSRSGKVFIPRGAPLALDLEEIVELPIPAGQLLPCAPPWHLFKRATCKGCFALGSACGNCERCEWERNLTVKVR